MNDLCTTCLCADRNLYYIDDKEFYHIYSQILSEIQIYDASQTCVRVCWECCALLRRFLNFKHQVQCCYQELQQFMLLGEQDPKHLQKIPRLQSQQISSIDYPEIKTEIDTLDIEQNNEFTTQNNDFAQNNEFAQNLDHPGQFLEENFAQPLDHSFTPLSQDATEGESIVKDEKTVLQDCSDDCDEKKKTEKKRGRGIGKVKAQKETLKRKKKPKIKKTPKIKPRLKQKKKIDTKPEIKSDDACHDYDENGSYPNTLSSLPFEEKLEDMEDNFEITKQENDIYQNNEVDERNEEEEGHEDPKPVLKPRKPARAPRAPKDDCSDKPQCAECGKVFSTRKTLRYHLSVLHNGNNHYPCSRCGKVYQWKSNLDRHMRSHKAKDSGELHCQVCDKQFASIATYRQHMNISKRHVSEREFNYICGECGKKFVNKTRLRDHVDWDHLQKIKFRCQLCNKPFKCHTSLYVHMKNVHRDKGMIKDTLCHVCGKSYQNAAKLRYHIVAMHTTQTPYQCEQCPAAFGWYSSLYRHVREVHYKMKLQPSKAKKAKKRLEPAPLLPHLALPHQPLPQPGVPLDTGHV